MKSRTIYCCLLLLINLVVLGQSEINKAQEEYVVERCHNLIEQYEYMLNFIGDKSTAVEERDIIIDESYAYVFLNDKVLLEDDLVQQRQKARYVPVKSYLKNVYLYFKDDGVKFKLYNVNVSKVFEKDYLFALVYFDVHIEGYSIIENDVVNNIYSRVAEVKLIPKDTYWEPYVVDVRFPQEKDLNQNYQAVNISTEETAPIETTETKVEDLEQKFEQILDLLLEERAKNDQMQKEASAKKEAEETLAKEESKEESKEPTKESITTKVNLEETPQKETVDSEMAKVEKERVGEHPVQQTDVVETSPVEKIEEPREQITKAQERKIPESTKKENESDSMVEFAKETETPTEEPSIVAQQKPKKKTKNKENTEARKSPTTYLPQKKKLGGPIFFTLLGLGSIGSSFYFENKSDELYDVYNEHLDAEDSVYSDKSREEHYQEANDYHHYAYITKYGGYAVAGLGATWLILRLLKKDKNRMAFDPSANQYYLSLTPNQFSATAKIKF